jgi:hypothetical protein
LAVLKIDEKNAGIQMTLKKKAEEYLNRAMYIKKMVKEKEEPIKVGGEEDAKASPTVGKGYLESCDVLEEKRRRRMKTPN